MFFVSLRSRLRAQLFTIDTIIDLGSICLTRLQNYTYKKMQKKSKPSASNVCVNLKNGTIIEMLFLNVNMTVEALFLLYLQEKFGAFFTSAEREVKNSRRSGMYQSSLFLTRLSTQSLQVFGFIRLFDEVRAELVRDISRSLRFL